MSYSRKVPGNDDQLSITVVPLKTETSFIPHYQAYTFIPHIPGIYHGLTWPHS